MAKKQLIYPTDEINRRLDLVESTAQEVSKMVKSVDIDDYMSDGTTLPTGKNIKYYEGNDPLEFVSKSKRSTVGGMPITTTTITFFNRNSKRFTQFVNGKYSKSYTLEEANNVDVVNFGIDSTHVIKDLSDPDRIPESDTINNEVPDAKATARALKELNENIGDLSELKTESKTNLVDAINEAAANIGFVYSEICVKVSTTVGGAQTVGIKLRVSIDDNPDNKIELITDTEGKANFTAPSGSKFEIFFPHQAGCEDIKPISRYAVKNQINISAIFAPEATHYELLSVHVYKWVGNSHSNFANCPLHITIDGVTEDFETGSDGRFEHEIPFGTEYTLSVDDIEDMYVYGHTNEWKYTANASRREKVINYHDVEVGLFMCCSDGAEYTKDEFIASGRPGSDVVMFKIANAQLALKTTAAPNGNIFGIDLDDVVRATYNSNKIQWSATNVQFTSCPNGQSSDGFDRTYKIVNEGIEKSIPTPAATFCFGKQFNLGGTELNGFLGAVVQHLAVVSNEQELNAMLKIARPEATNNFTTMIGASKWTIDQYNATNASYFARTVNNSGGKSNTNAVLPFYAF